MLEVEPTSNDHNHPVVARRRWTWFMLQSEPTMRNPGLNQWSGMPFGRTPDTLTSTCSTRVPEHDNRDCHLVACAGAPVSELLYNYPPLLLFVDTLD